MVKDFEPISILRNAHAMTVAANFWPRRFARLGESISRTFETEPGTCIRGECHWQQNSREHPTLVLVHGLEGSCESNYMRGTAEKASVAGFNAVRLNQRNCGGTEKLTPTLYHSGLSLRHSRRHHRIDQWDGTPEVFAAVFQSPAIWC